MKSDRGMALILALLVLSFLSVIGCALLTTAAIDLWIGDNYKSSTQNLYLTEAGIDQARELLRTSNSNPSQLLAAAAGADGQLSSSGDPGALLAADDKPLIDSAGQPAGHVYVWLRNDSADGISNTTDTNNVLRLLSFGQIGTTKKVIEVVVQKGKFPPLPGVDVQTDPRLTSVAGLEGLVASVTANANDVFNGGTQTITNYGDVNQYKVAVVNGDVLLGPGAGYGMLLVRGALTITGNFTWNGLILVIGKGTVMWTSGTSGVIHGGAFVAQTLAPDGSRLSSPGSITPDWSAATIFYDAAAINATNQTFPYTPIAIVEK